MDSTSSSTSSRPRRFKPRDQTSSLQELIFAHQGNTNDEELSLSGRGRGRRGGGDGDDHAITDSSSVSSDAEDDSELESMTAKVLLIHWTTGKYLMATSKNVSTCICGFDDVGD